MYMMYNVCNYFCSVLWFNFFNRMHTDSYSDIVIIPHSWFFSGLKFLLFKFSLELILVVYKFFVNIYLTLIKFSGINFSGFEPTRKLIPHEINQL